MKDIIIYCDMDGVLADFNAEPNAVKRFKTEKGFFKKLKPIRENLTGVRKMFAMGYTVKILTTSPHKRADRDKRKWLKEYLPFINKKDIIYARPNVPKINYVENKKMALLIDDWGQNIREWLSGGGLHAIRITQKNELTEIDYPNILTLLNYMERL